MVAQRTFSATPASIRAARLFVDECLGETYPTREVVKLVTSELATNALKHAASTFQIEIDLREDSVFVSVHDESPAAIERRLALASEESGRGLEVVIALSAEWGWRPTPAGKVVWAQIR